MGSIYCVSIIFWTPTREEKNFALKIQVEVNLGDSPTRSCLLPAAVDVVDLIVLVEGYGLQAVSQRAIQDSYTWMESRACLQVAGNVFPVGHFAPKQILISTCHLAAIGNPNSTDAVVGYCCYFAGTPCPMMVVTAGVWMRHWVRVVGVQVITAFWTLAQKHEVSGSGSI